MNQQQYLGAGGRIERAHDQHRAQRTTASRCRLQSELYSVTGSPEWRTARWYEKAAVLSSIGWNLVPLSSTAAFWLDADQCDVVSRSLLRLYQRCPIAPIRWRGEYIARHGLRLIGLEPLPQPGEHTYSHLHVTLAWFAAKARKNSAELHLARASQMAPEIDHPDQQSRVYRGLGLVYAELGDKEKTRYFLDRAEAVLKERGSRWSDTTYKNWRALEEKGL